MQSAMISDLLYRKLIRSIVSSAPDRRVGCQPTDLLHHLQSVYEISNETHERIVDEELQNRPNVDLQVVVLEAKDLPANSKHPFCCLRLTHDPGDKSPRNSPKSSKTNSVESFAFGSEVLNTGCAMDDFVHPRWKESFTFPIQDYEYLKIEVYTTPDAQALDIPKRKFSSAFREKHAQSSPALLAVPRLSLPKLPKLHKLLSASFNSRDDGVLLGTHSIQLKDLPTSSWQNTWLSLHMKKRPAGQIHVKLRLIYCLTKQESYHPECDLITKGEFEQVVRQMHEHAAVREQSEGLTMYSGDLQNHHVEKEVILEQIAVTNQISWLSKTILELSTLLKMTVAGVAITQQGYTRCLDQIEAALRASPVSAPAHLRPTISKASFTSAAAGDEEIEDVFEACKQFIKFKLQSTSQPNLFPPNNPKLLALLDRHLDYVSQLVATPLWRMMDLDLSGSLQSSLKTTLETDAMVWWERRLSALNIETNGQSLIERAAKFTEILDEIVTYSTVNGNHFDQYFQGRYDLAYLEITLKHLDPEIVDSVQILIKEISQNLQAEAQNLPEIEKLSKSAMQLFVALKSIVALAEKYGEFGSSLELAKYQNWFLDMLVFWLETWQGTVGQYLSRMFKDAEIRFERAGSKSLISENCVIVLGILSGICGDWAKMDWQDFDAALTGITKITDVFCHYAIAYCRFVYKVVQIRKTNLSKCQLTLIANSMEHVAEFLRHRLPELLKFEDFLKNHLQDRPEDQMVLFQAAKTFDKLVDGAYETIHQLAILMVEALVASMQPEIFAHIDDLTAADDQIMKTIRRYMRPILPVEYIVPFLKYLDKALHCINENLLPSLWPLAVRRICYTIFQTFKSLLKPGKPPNYYEKVLIYLKQLEEFLRSMDVDVPCPRENNLALSQLYSELNLQSQLTERLILQYFSSLADYYEAIDFPIWASTLEIKLGYTNPTDREMLIHVKVIRASNLPILDASGSTDPFVRIQLRPTNLFSHQRFEIKETVRQYRNLNPIFNELFTFKIPEQSMFTYGAVLLLSVWDWDQISQDDLAGECAVHLAKIPKIPLGASIDEMPPLKMVLQEPKDFLSGAWKVLKERAMNGDENAKNFIVERWTLVGRYDDSGGAICNGRPGIEDLKNFFMKLRTPSFKFV